MSTRAISTRKPRRRKPAVLVAPFSAPMPNGAVLHLPLVTRAEGNMREYWRKRHQRVEHERTVAMLLLRQLGDAVERHRIKVIEFTRLAPGLLDDDNLPTAFKHIRDQVCAWIAGDNTPNGRGDDGPRCGIRFVPRQARAPKYGVRVVLGYHEFPAADGGISNPVAG